MAAKPRWTAYVVSHTHWDRAWYVPFEEFRIRLVDVMDRLLGILSKQREYVFCFDGQTVAVEDYLAIRPEKRALVERFVRQGRLVVGPWYVLPDTFLCGGEPLVRNLLRGTRQARALGRSMRAGYNPDSFGHISQTPQILEGFGLSNAVFWRGTGDTQDALGHPFWWVGPDGKSRVLALVLLESYGSLSAWGTIDKWNASVEVAGAPSFEPSLALKELHRLLDRIESGSARGTRVLVLTNGNDHRPAQPPVPEMIRLANARQARARLVHGTYEDYARAVGRDLARRRVKLASWCGEMREGKLAPILTSCGSSRVYLKQQNARARVALEHLAEPAALIAHHLAGRELPRTFLDHAWAELLRNHPHDDICGCSVDRTHLDGEARATHAIDAGERLADEALASLGGEVLGLDPRGRPVSNVVRVFNPLPRRRSAVVETRFHVRDLTGWGPAGLVAGPDGTVAPGGFTVDVQGQRPNGTRFGDLSARFLAKNLPACGYRTYAFAASGPASAPADPALAARPGLVENAHLTVRGNRDGTVSLTDKATGRTWKRLGWLEDREDAGDSYDWSPLPRSPRPIRSTTARVRWRVVDRSDLRVAMEARFKLRLPAALGPKRRRRGARTVAVPVTVRVSLDANARRAELTVELENTARDHRLQVVFPTGLKTRTTFAGTAFDTVERPVRTPAKRHYCQPPTGVDLFERLVAAADAKRGLAVLAEGLAETTARRPAHGTELALTLVRAFGWLGRADLQTRRGGAGPHVETPGGQCLRPFTFRLALYPFGGRAHLADAEAEAADFLAPARTVPTRQRPGPLPPEFSLVSVEPETVRASAIKPAESRDTVVVRVWNAGNARAAARVEFGLPVRGAWRCRLDEKRLAKLAVRGRSVRLSMRPREIATVEVNLARASRRGR